MTKMINVIVVGAGISGLTFSIALSRYQNVKVTVFERAAGLENASNPSRFSILPGFSSLKTFTQGKHPLHLTKGQVGNGLQLPCNAARVMRCLGLLDKLRAQTKHPAASIKILSYSNGKELLDRDLTTCEELYGAPWL